MRATRNQTVESYNGRRDSQITYMYGNAAPKYASVPQKKTDKEYERETKKAGARQTKVKAAPNPVNIPVLMLTLAAFGAILFLMIRYISLNSEITVLSTSITKMESEINSLKTENAEYYSRIMSSVDLEEVREVAIMDLGMVYASEDQIITYESQTDDYLEQKQVIKTP